MIKAMKSRKLCLRNASIVLRMSTNFYQKLHSTPFDVFGSTTPFTTIYHNG